MLFRMLWDTWQGFQATPALGTWLTLAWLGYLVGLASWIVLQKREPVATLSWILALAALPYIGLVIYYFIGPQKIRRQRLRRMEIRARLPPPPPGVKPAPEALELARVGLELTGLPPTTTSRVDLLVDGAATFDALLAAISGAQDYVDLEYYIFRNDQTGAAVRDALAERARAGVKVRLLLDGVGSGTTPNRFLRPLRDAGGEVAWFHPIRPRWLWSRPWLNMRTHRKIAVVDGEVGFAGGLNITDEQDERLRPDAYRDLHLRLEGQIVRQLELVFLEDWNYATRLSLRPRDRTVPPEPGAEQGAVGAQVVISGPDTEWEPIHRLQIAAIYGAQRRVWLVTPYFVPGEAARMALTSAALGGLDVRLLLPRRSDNPLATYAARSYFDELLAAGVKIYEHGPRLLHTKALLCDDVAIIGTSNFDNRSFRLNFEVAVTFYDPGVAAELAELIERYRRESVQVDRVRRRPLLTAELPESVARLLSPLL